VFISLLLKALFWLSMKQEAKLNSQNYYGAQTSRLKFTVSTAHKVNQSLLKHTEALLSI